MVVGPGYEEELTHQYFPLAVHPACVVGHAVGEHVVVFATHTPLHQYWPAGQELTGKVSASQAPGFGP